MIRVTILLCFLQQSLLAQHTLRVKTFDHENNSPLPSTILVKETRQGFTTDSTGITSITFLSNGRYNLVVTSIGFARKEVAVSIPHSSDTLSIELEKEEEELEEVIIQSTRTSRTIANVPTRVETIELEEIDEKNNMRPANVAMLLHESTGIQVQQTSATSGNSSIRIQGLDGRYTQLLKDGFANFGNFSSGLSVLEIPPLDLKQVEIIKGPASPLYGGGAIAGVINFISKTPRDKPEYSFILNQSNIGQTNAGAFLSGRNKKTGFTLLALYNRQNTYDVDNDDFTEVPETNEITIHPKLFLYLNPGTSLIFGNSFTKSKRTGGDEVVIKGRADAAHQYFEENRTLRNITTLELEKDYTSGKLLVRQSFSFFDRNINMPAYSFSGWDYNSYTDISFITGAGGHSLVMGGNFVYNVFTETGNTSVYRDNVVRSPGIYTQHTWDATETIKLETGLRIDWALYDNPEYSNDEFFVLPRVSMLIRYNEKWSSRIGGGIGYKTPTLFTEQTETMQYRNIDQLNNVVSEKSYGGTADVNFRTTIGNDLSFSFNHMFFYTTIDQPLVLESSTPDRYHFVNATGPVQSMGFESNAKFIFRENFKLFLGYTYTNTKAEYRAANQFLPLVPRSKLNSALIYEKEDVIKLGLEGYFTGKQYLSDGRQTPAFEELGFMAEKIFKKFSLYINFENFTDTRQSRYENVVNGSHLEPTFDEIWTHTEGFVFNGGIKIKL